MPARALVYEKLQLGPETVAGTAVTCGKRLLSTGVQLNPRTPGTRFRPRGGKYNVGRPQQKGHVTGRITGSAAFNDLAYLFASLLKKPAGGTPFMFDSNSFDPDVVQTYTMEVGSTAGAERVTYGQVTGLELRFNEREIAVTGDMIAQNEAESITPNAGAVDVPAIELAPKDTDVLVGDTISGLTALTKCVEASVAMRTKVAPLFTLKSDVPSFTEPVEHAPDFNANIVVEHNSVAAGYMADLRSSAQKFLRIHNRGALISVGVWYELTITLPFMFEEPDNAEPQGLKGLNFRLMPDHESGYGKAIQVDLVNTLTGL